MGWTCAFMAADYQSDSDSFNPTLWEEQRQQRMTVAFEFEDKKEEEDNSGKVKVHSARRTHLYSTSYKLQLGPTLYVFFSVIPR